MAATESHSVGAEGTGKEEILQRRAEELQSLKIRAAKLDVQVREHETASDVLSGLPSERKAFRLVGDVLLEQTAGEALSQVKENAKLLSETLQKTVDRSLQIEKEVRGLNDAEN